MPLRRMLPHLLIALLLSSFVAVFGVARGSGWTLALAAILFAAQVLLAAARSNAPVWQGRAAGSRDWAWWNTLLAALVYAWGAVTMAAVYTLTGLVWQHRWQYAAGLGLFCAGTLLCARLIASDRGPLPVSQSIRLLMLLTVLQGAGMGVAMTYIAAAGKLASQRPDWAGNAILFSGALVLALLSVISLLTYRRGQAQIGPAA